MITDDFDYLAPGGRSFTLTSGLIAGLTDKSRVLDIASGRGAAACALAERFGCRVEGFDIDGAMVSYANDSGLNMGVGEIVRFEARDGRKMDFGTGHYDLITAEGGALSYIGREKGIQRCAKLLKDGSYLGLTDLIYLRDDVPKDVREVYEEGGAFSFLNEYDYRRLLEQHGFEIVHLSMVPQSAWDRYYMAMRRMAMKVNSDFSPEFRQAMLKEIDTYYAKNAMFYVGYVYIVARMARDKAVSSGPDDLRIPVLGMTLATPPDSRPQVKKTTVTKRKAAPVKGTKASDKNKGPAEKAKKSVKRK